MANPSIKRDALKRAPYAKRSASVSHALSAQEYYLPMQVTMGTVVGGKVIVEGSLGAVLSHEPEEPFALSPEDENELLAAMAEIESGEFVSADELLESLRKYG